MKGLINYKLNLLLNIKVFLVFYISKLESIDLDILL